MGLFPRHEGDSFLFWRFTQLWLLRLLATFAVMGKDVRPIREAWMVYDRWIEDSRIALGQESFELDAAFRAATRPVSRCRHRRRLGTAICLRSAKIANATLVTFDHGLASACQKARRPVTLLDTHPTENG
jgi:hypothetical protein